jgi:uncharacterized protein (TIRG00374 family)
VSQNQSNPTQGGNRRGKKYVGVILGVVFSLLSIAWLLRSVETDEIVSHLKSARLDFLFAAFGLCVFSYILRAYRWPFFFGASKLSFSDSFRCLIIGFFMNNTLPARMGEFVRAHLGGRAANCSRMIVLATIAAERILDGLAISVVFSVLFSLGASPEEMESGKQLFPVAIFFAVVSVGVVCTILFRSLIFRILEKGSTLLPGKFSAFTIDKIKSFIDGFEPMMRIRKLIPILLLSSTIWGMELLGYIYVAQAFGQDISIGVASLFLAAANFSSLIPAGPGGIGVIELFTTEALVKVGIDREIALSMVGSQHLIQILVVGIPGSYLFFSKLHGKLPVTE